MADVRIIKGEEVTVYGGGQIQINKANYPSYKGGGLKLARSFGYLYEWEVLLLQVLARSLPEKAIIVNIGAGAGTSGLALTEARWDLIPSIYTVDIAQDGGPLGGLVPEQNAFREYSTPLINQILGDSYDVGKAWDKGEVDLVFVDGNHSDLGVERDIEAWLPHIKDGGFMVFHDYAHVQWPGVKLTVDKLMADQEQVMVIDLTAVYRIHKTVKATRKAKKVKDAPEN